MLTCPCNEDPLTSHFYIVELRFTGVYILIFAVGIIRTASFSVPIIFVLSKNISSENFYFYKNRCILHRHCCIMTVGVVFFFFFFFLLRKTD